MNRSLFLVENQITGLVVSIVANGLRTAEVLASIHWGGYPSEWCAFDGHYNEDGSIRRLDWNTETGFWREP